MNKKEIKANYQSELKRAEENLKSDAERLVSSMTQLIEDIKDESYHPNDCGEIQGKGNAIDIQVSRISELKRTIKTLDLLN